MCRKPLPPTPNCPNLRHQREHRAGRRGCHARRRGAAEASHQRLPPCLGHGRRTHHRPPRARNHPTAVSGLFSLTTPTWLTLSATTTSPLKVSPLVGYSPPAI